MTQPIWNKIADVKVPENGKQWTLAVEILTVGRLMKIEVPAADTCTPQGFAAACSADGDFSGTARGTNPAPPGTQLLSIAPRGALIARIGGSTADQTIDASDKPSRLIFSIGRKCIFTVPSAPTGSLFLAVNDDPARMADVTGQLTVAIHEAL
jgi:hypothetical protein